MSDYWVSVFPINQSTKQIFVCRRIELIVIDVDRYLRATIIQVAIQVDNQFANALLRLQEILKSTRWRSNIIQVKPLQ